MTSRRSRTVAAVALASLAFASSAAATPVLTAGSKIKLYDSYGNTGGGEFGADIVGTSSAIDFVTFCIEYNEHFSPGQELLVSAVSTQAVLGGVGGGNPDPLDPRTAYLFTKFTLGTLGGYDFASTGTPRVSDANSLQKAIWYIEQEISSLSGDSQALAWFAEADNAVTSGAWAGLGNVRALNLLRKDSSGNFTVQAQDQLYMLPVPEPSTATFVLLGGAAAVRTWRRRRG
jgi:hypothetical protein